MSTVNSEIISFYKGKTVFLTGGTGFVGKLVAEHLLRKCDLNKLYLLIRQKKGIEPKQRLENLFQNVMYDRLKKEKPNFLDKIEIIPGDISMDNLDLSEESEKAIIDNVNIVIHGAATVKFNECINLATNINVKGTLTITKLCHKIKHLTSYVYISTAFSNCPFSHIKEEFYKSPINCDDLINTVSKLEEKDYESYTARVLGKWPNTYAFTKAVAENAVETYAPGLPVSIFRPAIVVSTVNEPVPGWVDNIYGPIGVSCGVAIGALRVVRADPKSKAALVPSDFVAAATIAATYKTSLMGPTEKIPIYNFVPSKDNQLSWYEYMTLVKEIGEEMPLKKSIWVHSITIQKNPFVFALLSFLLHYLPAAIADLVLFCLNKETVVLKLYRKGMKLLDVVTYFATRNWTFSNSNTQALWNGLNKDDKELFNFNMETLSWRALFEAAVPGARMYLFKETPDTIPEGMRIMRRRILIQNVVFAILAAFLAWSIYSFTSTLGNRVFAYQKVANRM